MSHLERELELNGLEAPDELQIKTVTQQATHQHLEKPKPTCHQFKKPGHYRNQWRQLKRDKNQARNNTNRAHKNNHSNSCQKNTNSNNKIPNDTNKNNKNIQNDRKPRPVYPLYETCGKTDHSTEKCYSGANVANRPPPRIKRPEGQNQVQQRKALSNSYGIVQAAAQTLN